MTIHKSVLLKESIEALNLKEGMIVVDATLGGGGHSREILKIIGDSSLPAACLSGRQGRQGKLIAFDADALAIEKFQASIKKEDKKNVILVNANFRNLEKELEKLGIEKVDAILADIGYSSDQLEGAERGISFQLDSPLDMRFDQNQELTARKIVNEYSEEELERVLREFGEEKFARNIVRGILKYREKKSIENTKELAEIVSAHVPGKYRSGKISPATKTFQAIRIEVNRELESLEIFVPSALGALRSGGRLAIISFHSLEDRIVKEKFRENARGCICPKDFPVCLCQKTAKVKIITKRPLTSGATELAENPRARSAKLRVCEVI
ncbi:MAG: 16S rRNA (cytosine(1402)-N(4))-methyltransferase RsmH [Candidatus Moraniibacteriota bacterium]